MAGRHRQISPLELGAKAAVMLAGGALIWASLAVGVAGSTRATNPQVALTWLSNDARALSETAERILERGQSADNVSKARALAERALRRDATVVQAVRTLGLVSYHESNVAEGNRLLRLASQLSSRDLPTRLWLIEQEVAQNDIPGALHQYDIALRTVRSDAILFPVLIEATRERELIKPLAETLADNPSWREAFLVQLVYHGPSVANLALLGEELRRLGSPLKDEQIVTLLGRLDGTSEYAQMGQIYRAARGLPASAEPALVRNGSFDAENRFPPLDWTLVSSGEPSARILEKEGAGRDPALFFEARTGQGGNVASQRLLLEPGKYAFAASAGAISADSLSAPLLTIQCAGDRGTGLLSLELSQPSGSGVRLSEGFIVPRNCAAQTISLQLRSSPRPEGVSGWVDDITITRSN